jgi:DNA-binding NarL/FixJ family response regulator
VYRSLEAGAKGYLLKDRNARDIVRAVRTVAEGGAFIPDAVRELYRERQMLPELTGRESLVLAAIAEGLGNDDIAARLGITPQAVKYHVGNLLGKFGLESRVQLSNEARRRGFV